MRESDDVEPTRREVVSEKLEKARESLDRCEELLSEIKRLMRVVFKGGKGYINK